MSRSDYSATVGYKVFDMAQITKILNKDEPQRVPVYRFSNGRVGLQNVDDPYDGDIQLADEGDE